MIAGVLLALALGAEGAAVPAATPTPAPTATPGPTPPPTAPADDELEPEPEPGSAHSGWRHALALGPHSTTFFSKEGSQYTFHSASLGYLGSVGARGAFLHAFLLLPVQARQDGHVYATANYYRRRSGGDVLLGAQLRWSVRGAEAEAGPGIHGTLLDLPGKAGYRDFTALPLGAGLAGSVTWETRASRLQRAVVVGTYASVAYDFYDPLHPHDLAHGFAARVGVIAGLGGRR